MTAPKPRSRLQRIAPIWSLALRSNRLLKAERQRNRALRHDVTVARAAQANATEELIDANARIRRLESNMDFLVDCRFEEGIGAWMDGERPA